MAVSGPAFAADQCDFIRQGLAALPAAGGQFTIPAGHYVCAAPVVVQRDHTTLVGDGLVTLALADSANAPVIIMGDPGPRPKTVTDVEVRHVHIDGNRDHQQYECWGGLCDHGGTTGVRNNGISVRALSDSRITDVSITGARSGGIVTEHGCYRVTLDGISVTDSFFDGVAGYETHESTFRNMKLYKNRAAGISLDLHFDGNTIQDSQLIANGDVGIFMRDSSHDLFSGLTIQDSGNFGVFLSDTKGDTLSCPSDNEFRDLNVVHSKAAGFRLNSDCPGNRLTGNAWMSQNREGCISEGGRAHLIVDGSLICELVGQYAPGSGL